MAGQQRERPNRRVQIRTRNITRLDDVSKVGEFSAWKVCHVDHVVQIWIRSSFARSQDGSKIGVLQAGIDSQMNIKLKWSDGTKSGLKSFEDFSPVVDFFRLLGVSQDVTDGDLKKAYRKQQQLWHPDKNPGNEQVSTNKFKMIDQVIP